jgi:hypothetical protein
MSEVPLDAAGRRRSPATMPGFHAGAGPATTASAIRPIHRRSRRSSRSCGPRATRLTAAGCADSSWCSGVQGFASTKRSPSTNQISTPAGLHWSFAAARAGDAARSAWTSGVGAPLAWSELRLELPIGPLFCIISGPTRGRHWSTGGARGPAPHGRCGRRRAPLRAPSAPARSRRRNGARRRPDDRDPAPARPQQPRHHIDLPPRHRQRRDHRDGPRSPRTDGARAHDAATLTPAGTRSARRARRQHASTRLPTSR